MDLISTNSHLLEQHLLLRAIASRCSKVCWLVMKLRRTTTGRLFCAGDSPASLYRHCQDVVYTYESWSFPIKGLFLRTTKDIAILCGSRILLIPQKTYARNQQKNQAYRASFPRPKSRPSLVQRELESLRCSTAWQEESAQSGLMVEYLSMANLRLPISGVCAVMSFRTTSCWAT